MNNELFIHLKVLFFMLSQDIFIHDHQTLESWIGIYENYGAEGFTRRQNRVYSAEVRHKNRKFRSDALAAKLYFRFSIDKVVYFR